MSSDHRIITANNSLSLRWNSMQKLKTTHNDWSLLYNRDIGNKYTITVRNKFDDDQEISKALTPNNKHDNFVNAHMEKAAECIPTKLRSKLRVPLETAVRRKRDNIKTVFLCCMRFSLEGAGLGHALVVCVGRYTDLVGCILLPEAVGRSAS